MQRMMLAAVHTIAVPVSPKTDSFQPLLDLQQQVQSADV